MSFKTKALSHSDLLNLSAAFSDEEGVCLLFSGGKLESAEASYLSLFPFESVWVQAKTRFHLRSNQTEPDISHFENPWTGLKELIGTDGDSTPHWVGYLGYELGAFSDEEKLLPYASSSIPDAFFYRHAVVLKNDHQCEVLLRENFLEFLDERQKKLVKRLMSQEGIESLIQEGKDKIIEAPAPKVAFKGSIESFESYREKIQRAKQLIREGEIYQVNLSQQFQLKGDLNPFNVFQNVATLNPAPFMGYLNFPGFHLISSSPERFLCKKEGYLETRPIKGTAPRGKTQEEDIANREGLLSSPKEKAELLMITDLMRHDLGKISVSGTVVTDQIWRCESYTNVFHLVSIIHSQAKARFHPIDMIKSAFPAGSITGCPKLRAMEVIQELEKRPRGIYTGSIGYISGNGDFDFNVAIRTILVKDDEVDINLGGAIIADSDPAKEYEETFHKGSSLFKSLSFDQAEFLFK